MKLRSGLVAMLLVLAGCATNGLDGQQSLLSSGSQKSTGEKLPDPKLAAAIVSAMGGGLIGGTIGQSLDEADRRRALEAEYRALEYAQSGQAVTWKSDQSNRFGEVVAAQPYRVGSQDCRQYTHTVFTGGPSQIARGTACRNADGSWTPLT